MEPTLNLRYTYCLLQTRSLIPQFTFYLDQYVRVLGVVGISLVNGINEDAHVRDAVALIATAVSDLYQRNYKIIPPPSLCDENDKWESGPEVFR